jgi:hypothetical protein
LWDSRNMMTTSGFYKILGRTAASIGMADVHPF